MEIHSNHLIMEENIRVVEIIEKVVPRSPEEQCTLLPQSGLDVWSNWEGGDPSEASFREMRQFK